MPRLSADVLDSKADDWTISDDGRDYGPTTSWPAPRIRYDDRNPAFNEKSILRRPPGLPDAYAFLRMKVDPTIMAERNPGIPNVPIDDAMMLCDGRTISQPVSSFPAGAGMFRPDGSIPVQQRERTPREFSEQAGIILVPEGARGRTGSSTYDDARMLLVPEGSVARGNGALIQDDFLLRGKPFSTNDMPDAGILLRGGASASPHDAGILLRDVAQGPNISLKGLPSYRVVPEPTVSLEEDWPGHDRFEAGILRRFLARTDAGALDGWVGMPSEQCQGILDIVHDAGMSASWYDVITQAETKMLSLLQAWSGGKLNSGDVSSLKTHFHDIRNTATSDKRWDYFNRAKQFSFNLLNSVDSPIISGGRTAAEAVALFKNVMGKGPKPVITSAPVVRAPMSPNHGAHVAEFERMWKGLEAHVNTQSQGNIFKSIGQGVASVGKGAFAIAKGIATPVAALVTSPYKLTADIASGKNVFASLKDTVKRDLASVKEVAPYAQAVLSVVPGVGQGINMAIAAGSAIAQGQPITAALIAGVKGALPGGPLAAQAFDSAYKIARGENLSDVALQAVINRLPGGEVAKQAAQTAIAVAKGQNIQQAALGIAKATLPGGELTQAALDVASGKSVKDVALGAVKGQAMHFTNKLSPFATGPMNGVGPRILNTVKPENLPSLLPKDARLVAQSLLRNPSLRSLPIAEVARRLNVPTHVAREGAASVLQSVQRSGGSAVPMLAKASAIEQKIPFTATFDQMMSRVASRAAPPSFSHNATTERAAQLRQHANVFRQLQARGLDAGALDPKLMPTIRQGSTGEAVVQWQKILNVTADGKFGPQTATATKAFQQKKGLTADGIVGPQTWLAGLGSVISAPTMPGAPPVGPVSPPPSSTPVLTSAMPVIRRGSKGAPVKTWQTFLAIPVDGDFGPQTESATKAFQTKNGLVSDGIVGPQTWAKAMSGTSSTPPAQPPIINLPPITLPPLIPGQPPITLPPVVVSQPPPGSPPGTPPIITFPTSPPGMPPNPPGQPPAPPSLPPITTSPPGMPPVVLPPATPPTPGSAKSALLPVAIGLGLLVFVMSGSSKKLL